MTQSNWHYHTDGRELGLRNPRQYGYSEDTHLKRMFKIWSKMNVKKLKADDWINNAEENKGKKGGCVISVLSSAFIEINKDVFEQKLLTLINCQ